MQDHVPFVNLQLTDDSDEDLLSSTHLRLSRTLSPDTQWEQACEELRSVVGEPAFEELSRSQQLEHENAMLKAMLKEREVHIGEKDVLVKEMCKQQTTLQVETLTLRGKLARPTVESPERRAEKVALRQQITHFNEKILDLTTQLLSTSTAKWAPGVNWLQVRDQMELLRNEVGELKQSTQAAEFRLNRTAAAVQLLSAHLQSEEANLASAETSIERMLEELHGGNLVDDKLKAKFSDLRKHFESEKTSLLLPTVIQEPQEEDRSEGAATSAGIGASDANNAISSQSTNNARAQ